MDLYPIVDISSWKHENINVSGSKEKRWYRSLDKNELALFKLPVSMLSQSSNGEGESTGEVWSEKISSEIGDCIGFPTHNVDIGALIIDDKGLEYYGLKVKNSHPQEVNKYLSNVAKLTDEILENIINKVPSIVMSEPKKELVNKILKTRRDYLLK